MVLLLKPDKSLVISKMTKLLQQENAVDNLWFYIPTEYQDIKYEDPETFNVTFYYLDPGNVAHAEVLENVESDKDLFLKYQLPVTTKLTAIAGTVTGHLSLTQYDKTTGTSIVEHSYSIDITIDTWEDYYRFVPPESLTFMDEKMVELDNKIDQLKSIASELDLDVPSDLQLTDDLLQLANENGTIGDGVKIVLTKKDNDNVDDGELDLDSLGS